MPIPFDIEIEFKGHKLDIDGWIDERYQDEIRFVHIYLSDTDIEISDKLSTETHKELCETILNLEDLIKPKQ